MPLFCLPNVIVRVARKVDKPTISSGSTTPYANAVVAWCAERCRSRKSWPTTSAPCGISFTTITHSNGPNVTSLPLHDYLRIQRSGNSVTASYSENGYDWTTATTEAFPTGSTVQVGLDLINQWQD